MNQKPPAEPTNPRLPEYVEQAVAKAAQELGFTAEQFAVSFEAGSNCDGLIGEIYQAIVTEGDREVALFCKIPPLDPARREQFNSMGLFEREMKLYSTVLPAMLEFQREKGVAEEDGFFSVAKCYSTYLDMPTENALVLMENLRTRNLRTWNKLMPIDYDHARLLMISLGRFHGVSLALKDQRPELFEQFKLPDVMLSAVKENPQMVAMFEAALDNATSLLDTQEIEARTKMDKLKKNYMSVVESCLDGTQAEPYTVLNHGDCWVNNILYGYKGDSPNELVLIDWQLSRYVSPALDVLYFLFCCSDQPFREKHFSEMLRIYHTSLTILLERLGCDATQLFPFTALEEQLARFGKFIVIMGAFDIPILCTDPADMPDLGGDISEAFATSPAAQRRYASRMLGLIHDAIQYGYL
ncbi:uncharacterized protein LOC129726394 [Wyeomyia smithii]|uniref:uncharacterized protein LOC129726394 n=1 Tax=Wyeomyia smithii TaxID=174621 RepID=UPI0024681ECA|nr:uncharacterized protein LOC129726394 [Wyeomyia smithii]XP_055538994.1 uncharacterized protein LOC129726394 [Wyeomyia smithii]XP_055538995.1 uncharacterized protein LOC129726394 [Wyeomyia smithii]XP_055538996.1 uncharacterized protein LOC129726394 [Wyeomyia smithii]XP_055538997.1 uncharacterized protein LOC129726394 [Wyeomyia smithii]XP_055538998.1 uncharacterized protein LOC129726394 [Wyeomyia smithii]